MRATVKKLAVSGVLAAMVLLIPAAATAQRQYEQGPEAAAMERSMRRYERSARDHEREIAREEAQRRQRTALEELRRQMEIQHEEVLRELRNRRR